MPVPVPDDVFGLFTVELPMTLWIDGLWAGSKADAECIMAAYGGVGVIEQHLDHFHVLFSSVNHRLYPGVPLEVSLVYGDMLMGIMFSEEPPPTNQYDGGCNTYISLLLDPLEDVTDRFFRDA